MNVEKSAEIMNVAPRQVERARVVHRAGRCDVRDALDRGRISASAAEGIARLPDEAQPEVVAVALANGARAIMSSRHEPDDSLTFSPHHQSRLPTMRSSAAIFVFYS